MKLLYLTLDTPLDIQTVATGNQLRVLGIREALEAAGHEVVQRVYTPDPDAAPNANTYHTREELEDSIRQEQYAGIIVGYWSLLAHLPGTELPVILDFIAPRLLELMFQEPEAVPDKTRELVDLLYRVDHILVGNSRQSDLLLPLLLQAGIDCRQKIPVSIVPISARAIQRPAKKAASPLQLVNAGVDWPWRKFDNYRKVFHELEETLVGIKFTEYSGVYPGNREADHRESTLQSYSEMQLSLQQCHLGVELGERNTEREFSHSFRAIEYLECGLPIIINSWIPLAEQIIEYDAGWVIDGPDELRGILLDVLENPQILQDKQAGVEKLKSTKLNYQESCLPLLEYLAAPAKALRIEKPAEAEIETEVEIDSKEAQENSSKSVEQGASTTKIILASLFKKYLCPARPESTPDILMVTRSDLFRLITVQQ
jgi:hypothetical protein